MNITYEIVTNKIIEKLEKGNIPWKQEWRGAKQPFNLITKKRYNGINFFLLFIEAIEKNYTSNYWATFKQISEAGGTVKKGEKSMPIIFWNIVDISDDGEEKHTVPMLRYYNVFNLDQTEGITPEGRTEAVRLEADNLIATYGKQILIQHGESAYYSPSKDKIVCPYKDRFISDDEYYKTMYHEMIHSTGHPNRLNRFSEDQVNHIFGSESYSKEELVAELGAAFLAVNTGLNLDIKNSAAYIQGWSKALKDDKTLIISAAAKAQKAADYITEAVWSNA